MDPSLYSSLAGMGSIPSLDPNSAMSGINSPIAQANQAASPTGAMTAQQKMMLAQALMRMGQQGVRQPVQMPQMNMQGNLPGSYVSR